MSTSPSLEIVLRFIAGRQRGGSCAIRLAPGERIAIGRRPECDVQLTSESVSGRHCILSLLGRELRLEDLASANGTMVDGERARATQPVEPPVIVRLGEQVLQLLAYPVGSPLAGEIPSRPRPPDPMELAADQAGVPGTAYIVRPGASIGGTTWGTGWQVLERIGEGARSEVFLGRRAQDGVLAALKLVHPERLERGGLTRFGREVRILEQLDHPNIVRIYHSGAQAQAFFIAFEWVRGEPLASVLERRSGLSPASGLRLFGQMASALGHAASRQILHRDVNPNNVLLSLDAEQRVEAHLIDFGLGKQQGEIQLTAAGEGLGTLGYLALEQMTQARDVDARADIYGLGATMFHALSGRPPYFERSAVRLMNAMSASPPPALRSLCPAVSEPLAAVVERCLQVNPEDRFADFAALESALAAVPQP